jgi:3-methylfumaryl-CoA hydratase
MTETTVAEEVLTPELQAWIGRSYVVEDEITLPAVRRIAATLDLPPDFFARGAELPPHWYTMFFPEIARQSAIGPDGHPRKGGFLPPIPLPRRMFAGRRVSFSGQLRVGDLATKRTEIVAITPKAGRSGRMFFLTVRYTIEVDGRSIAVEEADAVYREALPRGTPSVIGAAAPAPSDTTWSESTLLDPVLLFRYSAITWNGHRIHYDADYARDEEGYPNCVQNGGLTIQLLVDGALRRMQAPLRSFSVRMMRPLFVGQTLVVAGRDAEDGRMAVWAAGEDGALVAKAEMEFAT